MFVKVLASTAAVASGVVLRGMSFDATAHKVLIPNWGVLADGDLLYYEVGTDGTAQGGLTDKRIYEVASQDLNGFKLKTVADADLSSGTAVELTTATAGNKTNTFTKVAKKVAIAATKQNNAALTLGAGDNLATADNVIVYCQDTATCGLKKDNGDAVTEFANGSSYFMGADVNANADWAAADIDSDASGTAVANALDNAGASTTGNTTQEKLFLIVKGTVKRYPVQDANAYDVSGNKITGQHPFTGTSTYAFYTASTVQGGLADKTVYHISDCEDGKSFKLKAHATGAPHTADAAVTLTDATAGSGGSLQVVTTNANSKIASAANTDNKLTCTGNTGLTAGTDEVIFYCVDKTKCAWNGPADGATYKVKSTSTNTVIVMEDLASTPAEIAISADVDTTAADTNKAFLLKKEKQTDADKTNKSWNIVAAPAGASAARGLAMFGSAVAMATAFLMG